MAVICAVDVAVIASDDVAVVAADEVAAIELGATRVNKPWMSGVLQAAVAALAADEAALAAVTVGACCCDRARTRSRRVMHLCQSRLALACHGWEAASRRR